MTTSSLKDVKRYLEEIAVHLESCNRQGLYNATKKCEDLIKDLLNAAWNLRLENLNDFVINHPVIDLGDRHQTLGVQVTSYADISSKVQQTVKKFEKSRNQPIGTLCERYKHLIIFSLSFKKYRGNLPSKKTYRISIWNFQTLCNKLRRSAPEVVKACLDLLRRAKDEGLLYAGNIQANDLDFNLKKTLIKNNDQSYFAHGLGSVRIDAYLPVTYEDKLSCLLQFRDVQLSKGMKAYGENTILGFFRNREEGVSLNRSFIVGFDGPNTLLELQGERFWVEHYFVEQLCILIDELREEYLKHQAAIRCKIGGENFKNTPEGRLKLLSVPSALWEAMYNFANQYDALAGDSSWHLFSPKSDMGGRQITLLHGQNHPFRGNIPCQIWCEYENTRYCTLYWEPGYFISLGKMEGYDNMRKWKADYLHDWLLEKWIPYILYDSIRNRRSLLRWWKRRMDFQEFQENFCYQQYGISSYKQENGSVSLQ